MWTLLDSQTGAMHAVDSNQDVLHPVTGEPLKFTLLYIRNGVEMYHGLNSAPFPLQLPDPHCWVMLRGPMVLLKGDVDTWRAQALKSKPLHFPVRVAEDEEEIGAVAKAAAKAAQKRHAHALKTMLRKRSAAAMPSSPVATPAVGAAADESEVEESCLDAEEEMEDIEEEEEVEPCLDDEEEDVELSEEEEVY
jgi:hypothetical protein